MTPFRVLVRAFFAQFFISENVSSDMRMRESMIFVLAFVLTPCLFLMVSTFPQYQELVTPLPRRFFAPASAIQYAAVRHRMAEDMVDWIVAVLVGYAMAAAGLVAVFVWDSLTFDRRDVMVLGPLPMRRGALILAKLLALVLFLLGAALGLNLFNASIFAIVVSTRPLAFIGTFVSLLVVTTAAATFVFAIIVTIRCALALVGGARFASGVGSVLQFVFVAALLVFLASVVAPPAHPGLLRIPDTLSPPMTWFVAAFEVLRQSERGSWDGFVALSRYVVVVPIVVTAALVTSVAAHRRQMQLALADVSSSDFRRARFTRAIAHVLLPGDRLARAVADFMLMTLARSPAQRAPIAINAAIGLGLIVVGLSRAREDAELVLLAIPLMAVFWTSTGMRASFFVPSELPAAWTWFVNAPDRLRSYRAAMRASIVAVVAPVTVAIAVGVGGWRHGVVTLVVGIAFAAFLAMTINFIPFTRPYRSGHARLRRRWPFYLIGAYALSYGVVAVERRVWSNAVDSGLLIAGFAGLAIACDVAGRYIPKAWTIGAQGDRPETDGDETIVLGLDAAENRPPRAATS